MSFGKDIFTGLVQTAWDFTVGSSCCKRSMYECLLRQVGIMKPIKFYKLMLVRARLWARTTCCFCCHCCRDEVGNQTLLTMNELPSYAFCIRCRKCLWKPMKCSLWTKGWLHCQISISHHIWPSTPKAETFNAHTHTQTLHDHLWAKAGWQRDYLVGGFKHFLFHPYLGKIPILTRYFSNGLKPPTSHVFFECGLHLNLAQKFPELENHQLPSNRDDDS